MPLVRLLPLLFAPRALTEASHRRRIAPPRAQPPPACVGGRGPLHRVRDVEPHPPMSSLRPVVRRSPCTAQLRRASTARHRGERRSGDLLPLESPDPSNPRSSAQIRSGHRSNETVNVADVAAPSAPRKRHVSATWCHASEDWVNQSRSGQPWPFCKTPPAVFGNKPAVHCSSKLIRSRSCFFQFNPWRHWYLYI